MMLTNVLPMLNYQYFFSKVTTFHGQWCLKSSEQFFNLLSIHVRCSSNNYWSCRGSKDKANTIKVGDEISVDKYISEKDLDKYVELTGDNNPIHMVEPRICHGAYLHGLVSWVMGTKLPGPGYILLKEKMKFPNACYINQTVTINVKIVGERKWTICNYYVYSHKDNVNVMEGECYLV